MINFVLPTNYKFGSNIKFISLFGRKANIVYSMNCITPHSLITSGHLPIIKHTLIFIIGLIYPCMFALSKMVKFQKTKSGNRLDYITSPKISELKYA